MKSKKIHEIMIECDTSYESNKQDVARELRGGKGGGQGGPL